MIGKRLQRNVTLSQHTRCVIYRATVNRFIVAVIITFEKKKSSVKMAIFIVEILIS